MYGGGLRRQNGNYGRNNCNIHITRYFIITRFILFECVAIWGNFIVYKTNVLQFIYRLWISQQSNGFRNNKFINKSKIRQEVLCKFYLSSWFCLLIFYLVVPIQMDIFYWLNIVLIFKITFKKTFHYCSKNVWTALVIFLHM